MSTNEHVKVLEPMANTMDKLRELAEWVSNRAEHGDECPLWATQGTEYDCQCGLKEARELADDILREEAQGDAGAVDALERVAALLHEEATGEPWTVAGVEHPGVDRAHYRELARKVAATLAASATPKGDAGAVLARGWYHWSEEEQDYELFNDKDEHCDKCIPVLIVRADAASATSEPDADLELIWHSVSDNAETNAAYRRLKARLAALKAEKPTADEVLIAVKRDEGYEDVHPELVAEDFVSNPSAWCYRVLTSAQESEVIHPAGDERRRP